MQNLLISHIEFRNEESDDVVPYVFRRTLKTIMVPLDGKLLQVKDDYIRVMSNAATFGRELIRFIVGVGGLHQNSHPAQARDGELQHAYQGQDIQYTERLQATEGT